MTRKMISLQLSEGLVIVIIYKVTGYTEATLGYRSSKKEVWVHPLWRKLHNKNVRQ